jgi:predicted metal-dependent hydrolase
MITVEEFRDEVTKLARDMKVEAKEIHVKPMKTKWASCSSNGRLTFDSALLDQPESFRREVIVHELLHLSIPNHGRLFKVLKGKYTDDGKKND